MAYTSVEPDRGLGIRGKILATFTVMALIPLLIMGFFTAISITDLGGKSVEDSTDALKTQANTDLATQTEDKSVQVEQFFNHLEADGKFLKEFAYDVYNYPMKYEVTRYPNYKYSSNTVPYLPAWGYVHTANDERMGAWADWDDRVQACPYLNSSVVKHAAENPVFARWLRNEINLTLAFDNIFKPIYENNQPNVVNVWMVRRGGLTNSYSVPALDYGQLLKDGEITDDWDEDSENYVTLADNINNPLRKVVWTDPYFDPVGNGWMVSCIGPIYKENLFIGTVGIDVQLDLILNSVLDITMYKTGHAFLIDTVGNTIAHKDLDSIRNAQMQSDPDNTDVHISSLESDSEEFFEFLSTMYKTDRGQEKVIYDDGESYYIGYHKITGTNFILGIVVSEEEVINSVQNTKKGIEETTNETLFLIIIINIISLVFILGVGLAVANRIVTPINDMINISQQLGVGEIDEKIFSRIKLDQRKVKKDEIGVLWRSFGHMVESINKNVEREKQLKKKETAPIPQQLIQDIKIEIHDSVLHRSNIGIQDRSKKQKPGETEYCLSCGKDLPVGFSGKFCPHCGEGL